eukprot:5043763-Prymnesium_polylepis.1
MWPANAPLPKDLPPPWPTNPYGAAGGVPDLSVLGSLVGLPMPAACPQPDASTTHAPDCGSPSTSAGPSAANPAGPPPGTLGAAPPPGMLGAVPGMPLGAGYMPSALSGDAAMASTQAALAQAMQFLQGHTQMAQQLHAMHAHAQQLQRLVHAHASAAEAAEAARRDA